MGYIGHLQPLLTAGHRLGAGSGRWIKDTLCVMSLSNSLLFCCSRSLGWAHSLCHPHGGFTGLNLCQPKLPEEKTAGAGLWPCLNDVLGVKLGESGDWHSQTRLDLVLCYRFPNQLSRMMLWSTERKYIACMLLWPPVPPKTDITNWAWGSSLMSQTWPLMCTRYTFPAANTNAVSWHMRWTHLSSLPQSMCPNVFLISVSTVALQVSGFLCIERSLITTIVVKLTFVLFVGWIFTCMKSFIHYNPNNISIIQK